MNDATSVLTPEQEREIEELTRGDRGGDSGNGNASRYHGGGGESPPPRPKDNGGSPFDAEPKRDQTPPPEPESSPGFFSRIWGRMKQWGGPKGRREKKAVQNEVELCRRLWGIFLDGVAARSGEKWKPTNRELDSLAETSVEFVNTVAPAILEERQAQIGLPLVLLAYVAGRTNLDDLLAFFGRKIGYVWGMIFGRRKSTGESVPGDRGNREVILSAPPNGKPEKVAAT